MAECSPGWYRSDNIRYEPQKIVDYQCVCSGKYYMFLAILKEMLTSRRTEVLALGTYRDMQKQFSEYVLRGREDVTYFSRLSYRSYAPEEFFKLLEDGHKKAMPFSDFLKRGKTKSIIFSFVSAGDSTVYTREISADRGFVNWVEFILDKMSKHGVPVPSCTASIKSLVHGDIRDTGEYVVQSSKFFYNDGLTKNIFNAKLLPWSEAVCIASNYGTASVYPCNKGVKIFVIQYTAGPQKDLYCSLDQYGNSCLTNSAANAQTFLTKQEAQRIAKRAPAQSCPKLITYQYTGGIWERLD